MNLCRPMLLLHSRYLQTLVRIWICYARPPREIAGKPMREDDAFLPEVSEAFPKGVLPVQISSRGQEVITKHRQSITPISNIGDCKAPSDVGAPGRLKILFLTNRSPYPIKDGQSRRTYNILKNLACRHEVHLLSLYESAEEVRPVSVEHLRRFCKQVEMLPAPCKTLSVG